jgi:predicted  nucleic acid-binding Zn-ribbon protein
MPHQCVKCKTTYDDGAKEILQGCECGGKFFFFISSKKLESAKQDFPELKEEELKQIESDIRNITGQSDELPVVLDFESINVKQPGKYEIDLINLFQGQPVIFKIQDGKYVIDLAETFSRMSKKK